MRIKGNFGLFLVILGVALYFNEFGWLQGNNGLYVLPAAFLGIYLYNGGTNKPENVRYITFAAVLLAIALFTNFESTLNKLYNASAGWMFLLLAGASALVYLVHTRTLGDAAACRKAIIRTSGLAVIGVVLGVSENLGHWQRENLESYLLPGALIVVGLFVLNNAKKNRG